MRAASFRTSRVFDVPDRGTNEARLFESFIQQLHQHAPALVVLATLVLVLLVGTSAQILAERLRIPATGPLLVAGLLFGPAVLALVQPELLGVTLRVVVRVSDIRRGRALTSGRTAPLVEPAADGQKKGKG